jgi:formylglycine-generating enzyme required for sulfatase activity
LDPIGGDPRFHKSQWVAVKGGEVRLGTHYDALPRDLPRIGEETVTVLPFQIGWAPVTVQEYHQFLEHMRIESDGFVNQSQSDRRTRVTMSLYHRVRKQLRHPNWPVVMISKTEAEAFCNWKTQQRRDGLIIRLPLESEVMLLRSLIQPERLLNWEKDLRKRYAVQNPVGIFQSPKAQILDLWGTFWQWCIFSPRSQSRFGELTRRISLVFGAHENTLFGYPYSREGFVDDILGFRCVLIRKDDSQAKRTRSRSKTIK